MLVCMCKGIIVPYNDQGTGLLGTAIKHVGCSAMLFCLCRDSTLPYGFCGRELRRTATTCVRWFCNAALHVQENHPALQ